MNTNAKMIKQKLLKDPTLYSPRNEADLKETTIEVHERKRKNQQNIEGGGYLVNSDEADMRVTMQKMAAGYPTANPQRQVLRSELWYSKNNDGKGQKKELTEFLSKEATTILEVFRKKLATALVDSPDIKELFALLKRKITVKSVRGEAGQNIKKLFKLLKTDPIFEQFMMKNEKCFMDSKVTDAIHHI